MTVMVVLDTGKTEWKGSSEEDISCRVIDQISSDTKNRQVVGQAEDDLPENNYMYLYVLRRRVDRASFK